MHVDFEEVEAHSSFAVSITLSAVQAVGNCFVALQMPLTACQTACAYSPGLD